MEKLKTKKGILTISVILVAIVIAILLLFLNNSKDNQKLFYQVDKTIELATTDTYQLNVKDATNKKINAAFSSTNAEIATVDKDGIVTGVKEGITTVITKVDGQELKTTVSVKNLEFIVPEKLTVETGKSEKIEVKENSLSDVSFESDNLNIVTVSNIGEIKGLKAGTAKVTVKLNKQEKICTITVSDNKVENKDEKVTNSESTSNSNSSSNSSSTVSTGSASKPTNSDKPTSSNSSSSSSSSSKPSNSGNSSSSNSGSSKPSNKPSGGSSSSNSGSGSSSNSGSEKPSTPSQTVSYEYFGKTAYNYLLNQGGKVINGDAYIGNPNFEGVGNPDINQPLAKVHNVGSKDYDYSVTLAGSIVDKESFVMQMARGTMPDADIVINKFLDGEQKITVNGRTYTVSMSKLGYTFKVSAKKIVK
ncbi:hypothetical protein B5E87_00215 [Massilimicrobiota sp. An142]|uniref:Ig-like domain-containing protein n=1 Tax=Massilimicrobiota sp. An142 TaxID=1965564 RepID=UPI000B373A7A|nr:Ig-like domain-containing protein [Massilimicrobiota sp. An142]OUQ15030.1 hypothetical protein B5E87_00215 [Massilimicrobiota sp. An142]